MTLWFGKKRIDTLRATIPRQELLRRSRILIIDDERPTLVDDLHSARFAVDYVPDVAAGDLNIFERQLYDVVLLDFGNVGKAFGPDEGLSLLRHIKRVNPAIVILAYTSKALATNHADFYRLADGVLSKDAGIADSLERIEEALRKAHSLENLWSALVVVAGIAPGSQQDRDWQDLFVRGLSSERHRTRLRAKVAAALTSDEAREIGINLLVKLLELGINAAVA